MGMLRLNVFIYAMCYSSLCIPYITGTRAQTQTPKDTQINIKIQSRKIVADLDTPS